MRPSDYKTPSKKRTPVRDTEDTQRAVVAKDNYAASMLVPFLPPTAAKLLLVVDGRFESIQWYATPSKIRLGEDVTNSFSSWLTSHQTLSKHFLLQTYQGYFGSPEYRIVAVDPSATDHDVDTLCVPLVTTKNFSEAQLFLDMMGDINDNDKFDYRSVWDLLSKDC